MAGRPGWLKAGWKKVGAPSGSADIGYEKLRAKGMWLCAGIGHTGMSGDGTNEGIGAGISTAIFDTYIMAYPEVMPFDAVIDRIGGYAEGGGGAGYGILYWAFQNTTIGGIPAPGAVLAMYQYPGAGFDGERFRSGVLTPAARRVRQGDIVWFGAQTKTAAQQSGFRDANAYRPILGENPVDPLVANQVAYIGWRTSAPVAYDPTITTFPQTGVQLLSNHLDDLRPPATPGGAGSRTRISVYYRLA